MPMRQKLRVPPPEFVIVTATALLAVPTTIDPKSMLGAETDEAGPGDAEPVSGVSCRPATVLSQQLKRPSRVPAAVGLNRTSTVQLSLGASVDPTAQVPPGTTLKSLGFALDDAMPNRQNDSVPEPVFVNVTLVDPLALPVWTDPKSTAAGDSDASAGGSAVPVSVTLTRPDRVLSQKLSKPLRCPIGTVGLKRTSTVHVSPFARESDSEHVPPATTPKSLGFALEVATPKRHTDRLPPPVFVSVTLTGSLDVPSWIAPKSRAESDTEEIEGGGATPVKETLVRPAAVLSQKLRSPLRGPVAVGLKRTRTVQLSPFARERDNEHVPPATTPKSPGLRLDDAMPKRHTDRLPPPEFMRVTDAVSLAVPSWTEPKSTTVGIADDVGPLAATLNAEAGAAVSPQAHAKAATAKSTDTSLRFWWGLAAGVTDEQWRANHRDVPPFGWFGVASIEGFLPAQGARIGPPPHQFESASRDRTLVCVFLGDANTSSPTLWSPRL